MKNKELKLLCTIFNIGIYADTNDDEAFNMILKHLKNLKDCPNCMKREKEVYKSITREEL